MSLYGTKSLIKTSKYSIFSASVRQPAPNQPTNHPSRLMDNWIIYSTTRCLHCSSLCVSSPLQPSSCPFSTLFNSLISSALISSITIYKSPPVTSVSDNLRTVQSVRLDLVVHRNQPKRTKRNIRFA